MYVAGIKVRALLGAFTLHRRSNETFPFRLRPELDGDCVTSVFSGNTFRSSPPPTSVSHPPHIRTKACVSITRHNVESCRARLSTRCQMTISHRFFFHKNKIKKITTENQMPFPESDLFFLFTFLFFVFFFCGLTHCTIPSWPIPIAIKSKSSPLLAGIISLQYYIVAHLRPELSQTTVGRLLFYFFPFLPFLFDNLILQISFFVVVLGGRFNLSAEERKKKDRREPVLFCFFFHNKRKVYRRRSHTTGA